MKAPDKFYFVLISFFLLQVTSAYGCQLHWDRFETGLSDNINAPRCPLGQLNDTGITVCSSITIVEGECPMEGYADQDAESGRDFLYISGHLNKLGGGVAGFDFTKLDTSGNVLPPDAESWECVRDNHTGLIWEVKSNDPAHPRYAGLTYLKYQLGDLTTHANDIELCGFSDWRIPEAIELLQIVHNGKRTINKIDSDYFPFNNNAYYTNTSVAGESARSWIVAFVSGYTATWFNTNSAYARLVRSDKANKQSASKQDEQVELDTSKKRFLGSSDNGTVEHSPTGLMWSKCLLGQIWEDEECVGEPENAIWADALIAVQSFGVGGYSDWRIPSKNELASLVDWENFNPSINIDVFPGTPSGYFWTSSPAIWATPGYAWAVDFSDGRVMFQGMNFEFLVRPVRDIR